MKSWFRRLRKDERGSPALQFALISPVLFLAVIGIAQVGILLMADTSLRSTIAEGARFATLYPRPTDAQIAAKMATKRFGLDASRLGTASFTHGTADGASYVDISQTYTTRLNFGLFRSWPVTLTRTRRAFQT